MCTGEPQGKGLSATEAFSGGAQARDAHRCVQGLFTHMVKDFRSLKPSVVMGRREMQIDVLFQKFQNLPITCNTLISRNILIKGCHEVNFPTKSSTFSFD